MISSKAGANTQVHSYYFLLWALAKFTPISKPLLFLAKSSWTCTGFLFWARAKNLNLLHTKCFHNVTQDWAPCIVGPHGIVRVMIWHIIVLNCAVLWYVMFMKDSSYTEKKMPWLYGSVGSEVNWGQLMNKKIKMLATTKIIVFSLYRA